MLVYVRPSNEALPRARVPGAQDQRGCPSNPFYRGGFASTETIPAVSPLPFHARSLSLQGWGLIDLPMRASNKSLLRPSLPHHTFFPKGVAGLSFTARIGRAQFHRARSASKKDGLVAPYPNHLRPRVARAQEINRLHPPYLRRADLIRVCPV